MKSLVRCNLCYDSYSDENGMRALLLSAGNIERCVCLEGKRGMSESKEVTEEDRREKTTRSLNRRRTGKHNLFISTGIMLLLTNSLDDFVVRPTKARRLAHET